ncbi:hypothetical protein TrRE_jg10339 [Triparma retinervis]|uniref:Endonuclease/exonuclease/phosphatase domain-containing protein n=1 Tax=Triparma retinervis TaxID=2557542 RepID=A0A9W6ZHI7_9STRA|nr:hypothetical protein TrRE_jg10339 [Triparma retinervis]
MSMILHRVKTWTGTSVMSLDTKMSQLKGGRLSLLPAALLQAAVSLPILVLCVFHAVLKPVSYKLLAPTLQGGSKRRQRTSPRGRTRLKVMTFNIRCGVDRSGSYDLARCVASILKEDPDVVLLQEVTDKGYCEGWIGTTFVGEPTPEPKDQVSEILRMLVESGGAQGWGKQATAEYVGPYQLEKIGRKGSYGIGVIAKRKAEQTKSLVYKPCVEGRQGRGALACEFKVDGGARCWMICTHLQHDPTGYEQEFQVAELLGWIDEELGGGNIVVGGDFNATPGFMPLRIMEKAMGRGRAEETTFPMGFGGIRLDYLFVRGNAIRRVEENKVLSDDTASDHFPMVCTVEV